MRTISSLMFVMYAVFFGVAEGRQYFVSPAGSDINEGTQERPFKTINRGVKVAKGGDSVVVFSGLYRETVTLEQSGSKDCPIVISAGAGEKVVISGLDEVGELEAYKGKIVRGKLDWDLGCGMNQVFSGGKMMTEARYPNQTGSDLLKPVFLDMNAGEESIECMGLNETEDFYKGGYVTGGFDKIWAFQCARIKKSSNGRLELEGKSNPWFTGKGNGYIAGVMSLLDYPGEWQIEGGYIYFYPMDGWDGGKLEVKRRQWCIDFNGKSYVSMEGVSIVGASVKMDGEGCMLKNCSIEYLSHFQYFTWSGYSCGGEAEKGHNGIYIKGNANVLQECRIRYSAGSGVVIKGSGNTVRECELSNIDYSGTYSCPVALSYGEKSRGGNRIIQNEIYRTGRDCIHMGGATGDEIMYNNIYESGMLCHDVGIIYVWGRDGQGTRIGYNWIHDNKAKGPSPGVYLDNYCRNFIVEHNVIWNCEPGVRINGPAEGHRVINNTLFNCEDVGSHTYRIWPPAEFIAKHWPVDVYQYESVNNLYIKTNPEKVLCDPDKNDFRVKKEAVGGEVVKDGKQGAYQQGGEDWKAGRRVVKTSSVE